MPTYEYECTSCGRRSEVVQRFSDEALTICDECGGDLRKIFSSVGVVFKGSGFYKTDSRGSTTSPGAAKKESSAEPAAPSTPAPSAPTPTPAPSVTGSSSSSSD